MDPIAKKVWCEALRSEEFKQCKGVLKHGGPTGTSYCCLGVARELFPALKEDTDTHLLSEDSLKLLGLSSSKEFKLANMNDDGIPFTKIADYIEKHC